MTIRQQINSIAEKRILILDGAMSSLLQVLNLGEKCHDHLCLTMPHEIAAIHNSYLEAGADIIETCSFNSNSITLSGYNLEHKAYEISVTAARIARECANNFSTQDKPRFVAGSIGPAQSGICWNILEKAYYNNAKGLLDGGADILLIETIFDTLNAKAALFAISKLMQEKQVDIPVIISASISNTDKLMSEQTLEAFFISIQHIDPLAVGFNCSLNAEKLLPFVRTLKDKAPCLVIAYPNAYEDTPESMSDKTENYFKENLVNIIGGCCGSTPAHIEAIAKKAANYSPRAVPSFADKETQEVIELCGLEPLYLEKDKVNSICNLKTKDMDDFRLALADGEFESAVNIARNIIKNGAPVLPIEISDEKIMDRFLDYALLDPYIAKTPFYINSSNINVLEAGLKRLRGKSLAGPINENHAELIRQYGAYPIIAV